MKQLCKGSPSLPLSPSYPLSLFLILPDFFTFQTYISTKVPEYPRFCLQSSPLGYSYHTIFFSTEKKETGWPLVRMVRTKGQFTHFPFSTSSLQKTAKREDVSSLSKEPFSSAPGVKNNRGRFVTRNCSHNNIPVFYRAPEERAFPHSQQALLRGLASAKNTQCKRVFLGHLGNNLGIK